MVKETPKQVFGPTINRISDVMAHLDRYAFNGVTRLAKDARVSASSVSRLINGKMNPSFRLVAKITTALEQQLGRRIDPRELVAEAGRFATRFVCDLVGCTGCLPERAIDEFGNVKDEFKGLPAGTWVTSRYPRGYESKKGAR
ncbi:MAG: helix-turn-helix transcriptional regulator [Armatimonadota bacterium]